jgi:hypothetical protein
LSYDILLVMASIPKIILLIASGTGAIAVIVRRAALVPICVGFGSSRLERRQRVDREGCD